MRPIPLTIVVSLCAQGANADFIRKLSHRAELQTSSSLQTAPDVPPLTASDHQVLTDPLDPDGYSSTSLGSTAQRNYVHSTARWWTYSPSTMLRFDDSVQERLWTGTNGTGTHSIGSGSAQVDSIFEIVSTDPNYAFNWYMDYSVTSEPNLTNPVTGSVHRRGVDFLLEEAGGGIIAQASIVTERFGSVAVYSWNTPYLGNLPTGMYHSRVRAWAEWEGENLTGNGWSTANAGFSVSYVRIPGPATAAAFSGGVLLSWRRRRAS